MTQSDNAAGQEVDAVTLLEMVRELRPASRWALDVALRALSTEGVTGTLVIQIPRQVGNLVEVAFVAGTAELTQRF